MQADELPIWKFVQGNVIVLLSYSDNIWRMCTNQFSLCYRYCSPINIDNSPNSYPEDLDSAFMNINARCSDMLVITIVLSPDIYPSYWIEPYAKLICRIRACDL